MIDTIALVIGIHHGSPENTLLINFRMNVVERIFITTEKSPGTMIKQSGWQTFPHNTKWQSTTINRVGGQTMAGSTDLSKST